MIASIFDLHRLFLFLNLKSLSYTLLTYMEITFWTRIDLLSYILAVKALGRVRKCHDFQFMLEVACMKRDRFALEAIEHIILVTRNTGKVNVFKFFTLAASFLKVRIIIVFEYMMMTTHQLDWSLFIGGNFHAIIKTRPTQSKFTNIIIKILRTTLSTFHTYFLQMMIMSRYHICQLMIKITSFITIKIYQLTIKTVILITIRTISWTLLLLFTQFTFSPWRLVRHCQQFCPTTTFITDISNDLSRFRFIVFIRKVLKAFFTYPKITKTIIIDTTITNSSTDPTYITNIIEKRCEFEFKIMTDRTSFFRARRNPTTYTVVSRTYSTMRTTQFLLFAFITFQADHFLICSDVKL